MKVLLVLLCLTVVHAQFAVQFAPPNPKFADYNGKWTLPDCRTYCNLTNGECVYLEAEFFYPGTIILTNYLPGVCGCYAGWGGWNCSQDISQRQIQQRVNRQYGCKQQFRQTAYNGSTWLNFDACPCSFGYIGINCSTLCQKNCGQDSQRGFCMHTMNHLEKCFCYEPWTGESCSIWLPTGVRAVKDTIFTIITPILFLVIGILFHVLPILLLIPKRGLNFRDHNKSVMGLKLFVVTCMITDCWIRFVAQLLDWALYMNPISTGKWVITGFLILFAEITTSTLWSLVRDIATFNEKVQKRKICCCTFGISLIFGIMMVLVILFITVQFLSLRLTNGVYYSRLMLPAVLLVIVSFFFLIVLSTLFYYGMCNYRDIRKVNPKVKFENLKFSRFLVLSIIVFAFCILWLLIWGITLIASLYCGDTPYSDCMGAFPFVVGGIVDLHMLGVQLLIFYMYLPDLEHIKYCITFGWCRSGKYRQHADESHLLSENEDDDIPKQDTK
jgi:hypothetical protein